MAETIWRYPLNLTLDAFTLDLPSGARIVHTGPGADGAPTLWAEVDPDLPRVRRRFAAVGTGGTLPAGARVHTGTFLVRVDEGTWVWHLYEVPADY